MSSPPLRVYLSKEEEESLFELSKSKTVPQRTKDRASAIRLSSMGWKVAEIARYLKWSKQTVRKAIHNWQNFGLIGLWDAPRQGRKSKLTPEILSEIEQKLDNEQRTYNSRQLCKFLADEKEIYLSERHLRRVLNQKFTDRKKRKHQLIHLSNGNI